MVYKFRLLIFAILFFLPYSSRSETLDLPIIPEVFKHEQALFDWHPEFNLNVPSFDNRNYPYIRSRTDDKDFTRFVHTLSLGNEGEIRASDFDESGRVDFADFILFANAFRSGDMRFDLDGDDRIGFGDFLAFVADYRASTAGASWQELPFIDDVKARYPTFSKTIQGAGWVGSRIVFDADDDAYTLLWIELEDKTQKNVLLYSPDHCQTWQVYELPDGKFFLEHSPSSEPLSEPPAIFIFPVRAAHPAYWASYHRLSLIVPEKTANGLTFHPPVLVSDACFGGSRHSGGATFIATRGGKTHVVWAEATEGPQPHLPPPPDFWEDVTLNASSQMVLYDIPGAPTYIATYDRRSKTLGEKVFLTYASPPNDAHNAPGICIDTDGYLHVISGAHSRNFFYLKSLEPNDAYSGWTPPVPTLTEGYWHPRTGNMREKQWGRQTYLAFVIDPENTLHIAFRWGQTGNSRMFPNQGFSSLGYQRKKADGDWEYPTQITVPPFSAYSIYYHKLAIDRLGRLFLSYSYWSQSEPYGDWQNPYLFPALLISRDRGDTWSLAETQDFLDGLR